MFTDSLSYKSSYLTRNSRAKMSDVLISGKELVETSTFIEQFPILSAIHSNHKPDSRSDSLGITFKLVLWILVSSKRKKTAVHVHIA